MDYFAKCALVVISAALIFIGTQAYQINASLKKIPTVSDHRAIAAITDPAAKKEALGALQDRMPLTWVYSGSVNVSGSVSTY